MTDTPITPQPTPLPAAAPPVAVAAAPAPPVPSAKLLQQIVDEGKLVRLPKDASSNTDPKTDALAVATRLAGAYLREVKSPDAIKEKHSAIEVLQEQIKTIDEQLSAAVSTILHSDDFQKLEASWRGLKYMVFETETGTSLKLRLLNVKRETLAKDLSQAIDRDQSALFKKVYEEEYGTYGGNPFSLLVADLYFGREPEDFELLNNLAGVASAAHTPLIAAADAPLFGFSDFRELGVPRDLSKIFESVDMIKWRSFRASDDARYVTLTLPRFLLRLPYGAKLTKAETFGMEEDVDVFLDATAKTARQKQIDDAAEKAKLEGVSMKDAKPLPAAKEHKSYLWGNSAYALGVRITNAFSQYGWCAAIRGHEGGGKVTNLPAHTFDTVEGDKALKCPTELAITDRRENELNNLGFIALVHRKGEDYAAFFGAQTTHKPKLYDLAAANDNAAISARLPYLLAASRFAHYLKVICRDKIGTFQTKETMAVFLNRWIMQYVLAVDDAGQEMKAKFPLRDARIDVVDIPGKPGAFSAVVFLRPHFQLEELTTSIRLVAELPPPAAA
jgi:type VI secretion system protein ImpC